MRTIFSLLFLIVFFVLGAYLANEELQKFSKQEKEIQQQVVVQVPRGTSLSGLSEILEKNNVVSSARWFRVWVRLHSRYSEFQAGQYRFEGSLAPRDIARIIRAGEVYRPVLLEVTIPEGFRFKQIVERFVKAGVGAKSEFLRFANSKEFLEANNIPGDSLEGYVYPATYRFYKKPSAKEVLEKGIEVFFEKLPPDYSLQVEQLGLSLNQAVVFASLIELETKYDDERPKVSEVIWRRLKDSVALAIDASIIYGISDYKGNLSRKHLRDKSNPYNTRVHRGLPPTAIGSPSLSSLLAVLSPSDEGSYYYVVDAEQGDRHHFSKSLKEHNHWVRKLVKAQRAARRKERAEKRRQRSRD